MKRDLDRQKRVGSFLLQLPQLLLLPQLPVQLLLGTGKLFLGLLHLGVAGSNGSL